MLSAIRVLGVFGQNICKCSYAFDSFGIIIKKLHNVVGWEVWEFAINAKS